MSDERRAVPESPPLEAKAKAPEGVVPRTPVPPPPAASDESPPTPLRRRSRVGLRIPDDEVARQPLGSPPGGEARATGPAADEPAIRPSRIITINPDPLIAASSATPKATAAPALGDFSDRVTPEVRDAERPELARESPLRRRLHVSFDDEGDGSPEEASAAVPSSGPATTKSAPPSGEGTEGESRERRSDPGGYPELFVEDLEAVEPVPKKPVVPSVPPTLPRAVSQPTPTVEPPRALSSPPPPPPLPPKSSAPPVPRPRPPLVIVPPHMGKVVAPSGDGTSSQRKGRLWWEDLFNDDYLRAAERIEDAQIAREVDFIESSLGVERGSTVLDLACGTGRHAAELAARGYEVVGFDLSLAMLARAGDEAQERGAKLNLVQGDMREMSFEQQFDGIYCWNTSFGYFDEEKNADVIARIHTALKAGGQLLLDVMNRDYAVRHAPSLAWFEGDGCVCMDEMNIDFITSRMRVKRTMMLDDGRSREIEYSMRVYSLHELGKVLHDHRFKVTDVTGRIATPGVFFGAESARTIVLAEKI